MARQLAFNEFYDAPTNIDEAIKYLKDYKNSGGDLSLPVIYNVELGDIGRVGFSTLTSWVDSKYGSIGVKLLEESGIIESRFSLLMAIPKNIQNISDIALDEEVIKNHRNYLNKDDVLPIIINEWKKVIDIASKCDPIKVDPNEDAFKQLSCSLFNQINSLCIPDVVDYAAKKIPSYTAYLKSRKPSRNRLGSSTTSDLGWTVGESIFFERKHISSSSGALLNDVQQALLPILYDSMEDAANGGLGLREQDIASIIQDVVSFGRIGGLRPIEKIMTLAQAQESILRPDNNSRRYISLIPPSQISADEDKYNEMIDYYFEQSNPVFDKMAKNEINNQRLIDCFFQIGITNVRTMGIFLTKCPALVNAIKNSPSYTAGALSRINLVHPQMLNLLRKYECFDASKHDLWDSALSSHVPMVSNDISGVVDYAKDLISSGLNPNNCISIFNSFISRRPKEGMRIVKALHRSKVIDFFSPDMTSRLMSLEDKGYAVNVFIDKIPETSLVSKTSPGFPAWWGLFFEYHSKSNYKKHLISRMSDENYAQGMLATYNGGKSLINFLIDGLVDKDNSRDEGLVSLAPVDRFSGRLISAEKIVTACNLISEFCGKGHQLDFSYTDENLNNWAHKLTLTGDSASEASLDFMQKIAKFLPENSYKTLFDKNKQGQSAITNLIDILIDYTSRLNDMEASKSSWTKSVISNASNALKSVVLLNPNIIPYHEFYSHKEDGTKIPPSTIGDTLLSLVKSGHLSDQIEEILEEAINNQRLRGEIVGSYSEEPPSQIKLKL